MFSLTHKISTIKLIKSQYLSLKILTFCIITKMVLFGEAWYGTFQQGRTHISTSFYCSKKVCFLDEFLKPFEGAVAVLTVCTSDLRHWVPYSSCCSMEDSDDGSKMADLLSYFQQQLTFQESVLRLCQPELETSQTHISGVASWGFSLRNTPTLVYSPMWWAI